MQLSDMQLSDVDLADKDNFVRAVPHEMFSVLRREAPVRWQDEPDGSGFWAVTRYADVGEKGECDFVTDIAAELPLQAIAELLGVPPEDRHLVFEWSNRMIGAEDPEYQVAPEAAFEASADLYGYANRLGLEKRANPGDDIVSTLLQAEVGGERLSELEFNLFFLLLSVAGNETT